MTASNVAFKMPQEPCPLPSLESDEESFVVLGRSIPDCSNEDYVGPIDLSVIAEAKQLISNELAELKRREENEEKKELLDVSTNDVSKMEDSTTLPVMPDMEKTFETANAISIASISADMSSEEVQTKISQIIEENIRLKDTVLQNNMSMKSQYERIKAWQEDVQKVHQAHKDKLLEAKNFIENLKKEKESLKQELVIIGDVKQHLEKEIGDLKKSLREKEILTTEVLTQRSDDNIKEFQLDVANKKIRDLETEIEKLSAENTKLTAEVTKMHNDEDETLKKMKDVETQLEKLTLDNKQLKEGEQKLRNQHYDEKEKLGQLELHHLGEQLHLANMQMIQLKNELIAKKQKEDALIMTTNALKAQLEMSISQESFTNLRTQLVETQTSLTQMEFARGQAYSQVSTLTQELSDVRGQLEELREQMRTQEQTYRRTDVDRGNDEIYALKMQLDVYKSDFEEERHAREVIKGEKDRLDEDMQNLQRRNQQLQEEIEMLRGGREYVEYPRQGNSSAGNSQHRQRSSGHPYKCPKCDFTFTNLEQLQSHVYRCIELDDNLP